VIIHEANLNKIRVSFRFSQSGEYEHDVLWDVAPCSLVKFTNVSEVLAASIIRDRHWVLKGL
jgi:hypothetical protein